MCVTGAARAARPRRCGASPPRSPRSDDLEVTRRARPACARRRSASGTRPVAPVAAVTFAASPDAQAQAVEQAVEQGRRVAARGGDAVVLIDSLDYLPPPAARRALAAARNIVDGGSLTVIATAAEPLGGETTVDRARRRR